MSLTTVLNKDYDGHEENSTGDEVELNLDVDQQRDKPIRLELVGDFTSLSVNLTRYEALEIMNMLEHATTLAS